MIRIKTLSALALLSTQALTLSSAHAAVWEVRNQWSPEWEAKYTEWARTVWDETIFEKSGTAYQGLHLDCADTVYSQRIIFSYENGLPFAFTDPTNTRKTISQDMKRFDTQPESKRLKSFLQWIYGVVSTVSLVRDSYPVKITRDYVKGGSLIRTDQGSHHSWTIKDISSTGIPHLIYSSRPAKNHLLVRKDIPTTAFIFKGRMDPARAAGFRTFKYPADFARSEQDLNGFSLEQYSFGLKNWRKEVQKRLSTVQESAEQRLVRALTNACTAAQERVTAVQEGLDALAKLGANQCFNAEQYENYSTPNRDERLLGSLHDVEEAYDDIQSSHATVAKEYLLQAESIVRNQGDYCSMDIRPGVKMRLGQLYANFKLERVSNNPHDPSEYRWGEQAGHSARAKRCPQYD